MKTVLVFKTSVTSGSNVSQVQPVLDQLMSARETWNFDLEDCDNILRVEAITLQASTIIENLAKAGFECAELEEEVEKLF